MSNVKENVKFGRKYDDHLYIVDSLWYPCSLYTTIYDMRCTKTPCIGIVKIYDSITKEYKTYIGLGEGENLQEDENRIAAGGASFYNPVTFDDLKTFMTMKETR